MALRMPGVGRVTVSLLRSMTFMVAAHDNPAAVARESKAERSKRFGRIVDRLEKAMPEAKIALDYRTDLELLVSVMLSAQCTDAVVNTVTPALFARYPTAAQYAKSTPEILGEQIKRVGLWRGEGKKLHAALTPLARGHGGGNPPPRAGRAEPPGGGGGGAGGGGEQALRPPGRPG